MSLPEYFDQPIPAPTLRKLVDEEFADMVKFVVDLELEVMCAGGGFHSDEETILLERGSVQHNLWGANYYPNRPAGKKLVYTSMINIRPRDGNTAQEIQSEEIRVRVARLAEHYFGSI
ncbi:MAG TPA: DUF5674 family protein [Elusimicrobiota bacterium]|nr:DUF5674 family protein [Elusimicrobiota bacterium]